MDASTYRVFQYIPKNAVGLLCSVRTVKRVKSMVKDIYSNSKRPFSEMKGLKAQREFSDNNA